VPTYSRQSDRWAELFGHLDNTWQSSQAPHQAYVDGLVDPSVWPAALKAGTAMKGVLHAQGIKDLHSVTQHMIKAISTTVEVAGGQMPSLSTGFTSQLSTALDNVMAPQSIGSSVAADLVEATLTDSSKAGQKVASAMFAAGMSALSAAGPVGMAAAAIIGLAFAVYKAVDNAKSNKDKAKAERVRLAFESFPPLQQPGGDTDEWYVKQRILPVLETGNWTDLFSPRFNPRKEWVGAPRHGGYGFAPGERQDTRDEYGFNLGVFDTAGGVGFLPGFNRITSVIQVSIDPLGPAVQDWIKSGGPFPIHHTMAQDVGSFYVNAGRMCSIAWSWATADRASPHLYKIHVGTPDGPGEHLHYLWRSYMGGGLEYLRESARQWAHADDLGLKSGGRLANPDTPEYVLGSAIGCGVASWACSRASGGTTNHPRFYRLGPPGGYSPGNYGISQGLAKGCVIEPMTPLYSPIEDDKPCLVSLYESHLAETLKGVRARQVHFLRNSLVCAYVSEKWDAFKDPKMLSLLRRMRAKLLTHRDRHAVQLRDVPHDLNNGQDWRAQLKSAGVNGMQGAGMRLSTQGPGSSAVDPDGAPEPLVPVHAVMPFAEQVPAPLRWWQKRGVVAGIGLGVGLGATALAVARRRTRR